MGNFERVNMTNTRCAECGQLTSVSSQSGRLHSQTVALIGLLLAALGFSFFNYLTIQAQQNELNETRRKQSEQEQVWQNLVIQKSKS